MARSRPVYYGWTLVWALGLTTIVSYGTTQYYFSVLLLPVQHDLHSTRAVISGAFSLGLLVYGGLGIGIGRIVDRRGARALMAAGSALGGGSLVLLSQVQQAWQFYALWAGGVALGNALTFYPVTFTVITNWFIRRRGSALAALTLLGGLAGPLFLPLAGFLVPRYGWRPTTLAFGLAQLAIALPLHALVVRRHPEDLGLLPDGERPLPGAAQPGPAGFQIGEALRAPAFWTLTLSSALSLLASSVVLAHQVAYLVGRGLDPGFAATAAGLVGVASLPGRYVINRLSESVGAQRLLALSCVTQGLGVVLLTQAGRPPFLWGYIVLYGAAFGAVSPLRASTMADQFGRRAYGAITAVQGLPVAVAAAAGPLAAGLLFDRLGGYGLALWLTAAAFLLAGAAVAVTPGHRPPGSPSSPPGPAPAAS